MEASLFFPHISCWASRNAIICAEKTFVLGISLSMCHLFLSCGPFLALHCMYMYNTLHMEASLFFPHISCWASRNAIIYTEKPFLLRISLSMCHLFPSCGSDVTPLWQCVCELRYGSVGGAVAVVQPSRLRGILVNVNSLSNIPGLFVMCYNVHPVLEW